MTEPLDLAKTEREARYLIQEIDKALGAIASRGQQTRQDSGPAYGSRKPYSGMEYSSHPGYIRGPQQPESQFPADAALSHIGKLTERLLRIQADLRRMSMEWKNDLGLLKKQSAQSHEVASLPSHYQKAGRDAQAEIRRIEDLLRDIGSALHRAGKASSSAMGPSTASSGSIDQLVTGARGGSSRHPAHYAIGDVTYQTVALLDADRPGTADYKIPSAYPKPYLGAPGQERYGELSDKVSMGGGSSNANRARNYGIQLPAFYEKMSKGHHYEDDAGRYSAAT